VDVVVAEVPGIENPRVGGVVVVAPVVLDVVVDEDASEVAKLSGGVVLVVVDCVLKEIGGVVDGVEVVTPKLTGGVVVVVVPFVGFVPVGVLPNENDGVPPPEPVVGVGLVVKFGAFNPPPPTVPKFNVGVVEEDCVVVLVAPKETVVDVDPVFVPACGIEKIGGVGFDFGKAPLVVKFEPTVKLVFGC